MSLPISRSLLCALLVLLTSCAAAPVVEYNEKKHSSAIEFGRTLVSELSLGLDKTLSKVFNREKRDGDITTFSTTFFPEHGPQAVFNSFSNYCLGISGYYKQGLCSHDSNETGAYFHVSLYKNGDPVNGVAQLKMEVREARPGTSGRPLIRYAASKGYVTNTERQFTQILTEQNKLAQQQAELAAAEKQRRAEVAELERRNKLSASTRDRVYQKGERICFVANNNCHRLACFSEDSNTTTKRVKVSIGGDKQYWYDAKELFACASS